MFHVADGLYFEDSPDGSVRIIKRESGQEGAAVIFDMTLDANAWASVIASMSYYGEEDGGFYRATQFHLGEPLPAVVKLVDKKAEQPCATCGQMNHGQTGEYPCAECGLPTLHDEKR